MKAFTAALSASVAGVVCAASQSAVVYTVGSFSTLPKVASDIPSIQPQTARLLLSQTLGLSEYHTLKGASEDTLQDLNGLAETQTPLFDGSHHNQSRQRVLLIVEGIEKPEGIHLKAFLLFKSTD